MLQALDREIPLSKILANLPIFSAQLARLAAAERIIAVVGTVKAGKSTTIDALIGQELLPHRNQPMTTLPTLLRHVPGQNEPRLTLRPVAALQTLAESCRAALASTNQCPLLVEESNGQRLVAALQSGAWQAQSEYLGQAAIFAFLEDVNDLLRLAFELHLPLKSTLAAFQDLADLPVITVAFANLKTENVALLDTPGSHESGQNAVLRGWWRHYLQQVDHLLVVTDDSQLESRADTEVTQLVLEQLGKTAAGRLSVVVNN